MTEPLLSKVRIVQTEDGFEVWLGDVDMTACVETASVIFERGEPPSVALMFDAGVELPPDLEATVFGLQPDPPDPNAEFLSRVRRKQSRRIGR
jgi:hypothetical protein